MRIFLTLFLAASFITPSAARAQETNDTTAFKTYWMDEFTNTILTKDMKQFRMLSISHIQCMDCLTNTQKERDEEKELKKLNLNISTSQFMGQAEHVPFEMFVKNDLPVIFDSTMLYKIQDTAQLDYRVRVEAIPKHIAGALKMKAKSPVYTTLITAVEANGKTKRKRYGFSFLKTRDGFRFFRVITES